MDLRPSHRQRQGKRNAVVSPCSKTPRLMRFFYSAAFAPGIAWRRGQSASARRLRNKRKLFPTRIASPIWAPHQSKCANLRELFLPPNACRSDLKVSACTPTSVGGYWIGARARTIRNSSEWQWSSSVEVANRSVNPLACTRHGGDAMHQQSGHRTSACRQDPRRRLKVLPQTWLFPTGVPKENRPHRAAGFRNGARRRLSGLRLPATRHSRRAPAGR